MVLVPRGDSNRIAHGYFDTNLDVMWETVQAAPTGVVETIAVRNDAGEESCNRSSRS